MEPPSVFPDAQIMAFPYTIFDHHTVILKCGESESHDFNKVTVMTISVSWVLELRMSHAVTPGVGTVVTTTSRKQVRHREV